jgi:ubiquinone biosynthesis protein COQ4
MLKSAEGRQILRDRPSVNSETIDMDELRKLPEGTFGRLYVTWLERCGVTPDTREPVRILFLYQKSSLMCNRFTTSMIPSWPTS